MEHILMVGGRCYLAYFYRVEDIWKTDPFVEISQNFMITLCCLLLAG